MGWRLRLSDKTVRKLAELPIYCHRQKCSPGNVVSDSIRFMQIFAGVRWIQLTLAFDWCHFWWPWTFWSTFEGHFSLGCHFHVHFSYPWHAFASHGLPAIAELLVNLNHALSVTVPRHAVRGNFHASTLSEIYRIYSHDMITIVTY